MKRLIPLAAIVLAACTETADFSQATIEQAPAAANGDAIVLAPAFQAGGTRTDDGGTYSGGTLYTSTLKNARFGVFAYHTGGAVYAHDRYSADFMYNQKVWHDDGTDSHGNPLSWTYEPVKYWPNASDKANAFEQPSNTATGETAEPMLSFFAYAPYADNIRLNDKTEPNANTIDVEASLYPAAPPYGALPAGVTTAYKTTNYDQARTNGGVVGMTDWVAATDPWVNYVMKDGYDAASTDVFKGIDLLWGVRGKYYYREADGTDNYADPLGNYYNTDLTKQIVKERVKFLFKHALAKFGGSTKDNTVTATDETPAQTGLKVVLDIDANSPVPTVGIDNQTEFFPISFDNLKTLVTLKSLRMRDAYTYSQEPGTTLTTLTESNFNTYGWFNLATGTWSNASYTDRGTTPGTGANGGAHGAKMLIVVDNTGTADRLNPEVCEANIGTTKVIDSDPTKPWQWTDTNPKGVTTTPKSVYANDDHPAILVIPGDQPQTFYVTLDYIVRTADPQLARGYSEVEQIITNSVNVSNLQANKYYTLVIHIGLTSVKFEAVVADWTMTPDATYAEDGTVTEGTDNSQTESVWLPANVVSSTTVTP